MVDLLHDNPNALKECCLVSKSWIRRTRKHLFAHVDFPTMKQLQLWKEMFPDPFSSPAYHTYTLSIICSAELMATGWWVGELIRGFSRVEYLRVAGRMLYIDTEVSFNLLHGFSPVVKSLHVDFEALTPSRVFDLVVSLPLLKDLTVTTHSEVSIVVMQLTAVLPPTLPVCTGTLEVSIQAGMEPIARRLLSLSSGIHFRELTLEWFNKEDPLLTMALLEKCSHTLESLNVTCDSRSTSIWHLCLRR